MKNKPRLGRGLEALLGGDVNEIIHDIENNYTKDQVVNIKLNQISPNPFQPRKTFNAEKIQELATSISNHGLFTPIIVKKTQQGYNIIAGERRYRACQQAGLMSIPAIIVDFDEQMMMEVALLENIQREDLNPIEEANALKNIMESQGYTQEMLAKKIGKSRSHIANTLRLLSLSNKVQQLLLDNKITMGHAKVLIGVEADVVTVVIAEIVNKKLSVRETEKLIADFKKPELKVKEKSVNLVDRQVKMIEEILQEKLNSKVKINNNNITIHFEDEDSLKDILERLDVNID